MTTPRVRVRRAIDMFIVRMEGPLANLFCEPRIEMRRHPGWQWRCTECVTYDQFERIFWRTAQSHQGALSDACAHLAAHHTAQMPPVAHGDPDGLNVAHNAIQPAYDTTRSTT